MAQNHWTIPTAQRVGIHTPAPSTSFDDKPSSSSGARLRMFWRSTRFSIPPRRFLLLRATSNKILYGVMSLYAVFRPSVLVAGGVLAVGAVEAVCSVSISPIGSLVDSAVRHTFGGEG